jgi:septation ring formation regulator EzrA
MGLKLSLVLGILLVATVSGSVWYIDRLSDQISILKGNQIVLESKVEEQNEAIDNYLAKQQQTQAQLNTLESEKRQAMEDVNRLRKTFARHDLDNLALAKPGLIQSRINKASARVMTTLEELSNPNQFDEKSSTN